MPTTTVSINPSDKRDVRALRILQGARSWAKLVVDIPGVGERRFYGIPSEGEAGVYRMANKKSCNCPDFMNRQDGGTFACAHIRAVRWYCEIVAQNARRRAALQAQLASDSAQEAFGPNVRVVGLVE